MKKIEIEIQYFDECPNSGKIIRNVKKAMANFATIVPIEYRETKVTTPEKALEVGFRGSPTFLINGRDFEDMPEPFEPALACRYYANGVPDVEIIKMRIQELINS